MGEGPFLREKFGYSLEEFLALPRERAHALLRARVPSLLQFFGSLPGPVEARTRALADSLAASIRRREAAEPDLEDRILTDGLLRRELSHDQNVYLGRFFTRFLTRSIPDVAFVPSTAAELREALRWARRERIPVTTRGAGTTALSGAVPARGGLVLDLSRLDEVRLSGDRRSVTLGAGARLRIVRETLEREGLALLAHPSNLGGTLAGWFATGGLGLNSFRHGPVASQALAAEVALPRGEVVAFHRDGAIDVEEEERRRSLEAEEGRRWLADRGYGPLALGDFAGTEGQFGVIVSLTLPVHAVPAFRCLLFEFDGEADAVRFALWAARVAGAFAPANLKFLSAAHLEQIRRVRGEGHAPARPSVYVDFDDPAAAGSFEQALADAPGRYARRDDEARRVFEDRFRPQQQKRLGPGLLAAEILLPAESVGPFLRDADRLAARIGVELESEVYYASASRALVLAGYLTDPKRRGLFAEILLAPALVDLARARHRGSPYVLGRWQAPFFRGRHRGAEASRLRALRCSADPAGVVNEGVFFRTAFAVPGAARLFDAAFPAGVRAARLLFGAPPVAALLRAAKGPRSARPAEESPRLAWHASTCVNCGECNTVCPVYDDARIRLPQMLTHAGERLLSGDSPGASEALLLDLCVRCGNCEEACQAGIPHLPLYERMQRAADAALPRETERHVAIVARLRSSRGYIDRFLGVRPGGYLARTPASLPGETRYLLLRSENEDGPEATCIHCAACVPVCPTGANREFEAEDPRLITTDLLRCIGCGTCVEVCPANRENRGRTLRVFEAPTPEFFRIAGIEMGTEWDAEVAAP